MPELERWSRFWGRLEAEGIPGPVYRLLSDLYSGVKTIISIV